MNLDPILSSAGMSRSELDAEVTQYRTMSDSMETVPADHFDVEGLATVVETLAVRLTRIASAVEPYLEHYGDERGDLARAVHAVIHPAGTSALDLVDQLINPELTGTLSKGEESLYGHPDLCLVSHLAVDFETLSKTFLRHLVHTPSGRVVEVPEKATVREAAAAFEKDLAGA